MAIGLAEAGADAALVASRSSLDEAVTAIRSLGRKVVPFTCDVADANQRRKLVDDVLRAFSRIDILVNNAGTMHRDRCEDFPLSEWQRTIEVNVTSVFELSQIVARHMLARGSGKIINIASLLSFSGGLTVPAYTASKHAVAGLTKAMANEWASRGINVNAIAPGYMETELSRPVLKDPRRGPGLLARIPAGRWGTPDDLKGAVVFLASSASDYIHGHILAVDGGWMAR
jgi:2-dehydro-3-deoxy-D-gluconate 5-dehydrogenase